VLNGDRQNSDIKWNAWSGRLAIQLSNGDQKIADVFNCEINPFTGNCGIKAISHVYFAADQAMSAKDRKSWRARVLTMVEGFLYHVCNCGLVIGSDNNAGGSWSTGGTVKEFGVDYTFSNWVWNPNYTWSKGHKVQVFSKELVGRNYPDETWRPLPIQFTK